MSEWDIQKLVADHAALQSKNAVLKEELALVQEQLAWLKKQMFGRKTEQSAVIMESGTQLPLFGHAQPQSVPMQEKKRLQFRSINARKSVRMTIG